jgi:hypothetical protein
MNTQHSRLTFSSDSIPSTKQAEAAPGAIIPATGHGVLRWYKQGVFPAVFRLSGANGIATVTASAGDQGRGRCTAAAQVMFNPAQRPAAVARSATRLHTGRISSAATTTRFAVGSQHWTLADTASLLSLPGLGEIRIAGFAAQPGPAWYPGISFVLRNTQSYPISAISDDQGLLVTARPGEFVRLPAMTVRPEVLHDGITSPEITQIRGPRHTATITVTGNLTTSEGFARLAGSRSSIAAITGCIGIAQAIEN